MCSCSDPFSAFKNNEKHNLLNSRIPGPSRVHFQNSKTKKIKELFQGQKQKSRIPNHLQNQILEALAAMTPINYQQQCRMTFQL